MVGEVLPISKSCVSWAEQQVAAHKIAKYEFEFEEENNYAIHCNWILVK